MRGQLGAKRAFKAFFSCLNSPFSPVRSSGFS
jgi:hypothetical protein